MYKPIYNNISLYFSGVSRLTITDSGKNNCIFHLLFVYVICVLNYRLLLRRHQFWWRQMRIIFSVDATSLKCNQILY